MGRQAHGVPDTPSAASASITDINEISVTGNPTHVPAPRIAFVRLVRADGTELLAPGAERQNAIDEQRRLRARERNRQK